MEILKQYQNGNATVTLLDDGTRIITTNDNEFNFDWCLNIDIRTSTKCSFGRNPRTGKGVCDFCHESSKTTGHECDYEALRVKLIGLPEGIELAVGCNEFTSGLYEFILWCGLQGYIVNLTVNQGHLNRDFEGLKMITEQGFVKGFGISYRSELKWDVPQYFLDYPNTVFHVIAGIDKFQDIEELYKRGVKKILLLGYKKFGFGVDFYNEEVEKNIKEWYWWVRKIFDKYETISFDNLALEQLNIRRFLPDKQWEEFNQGEYSMYINAVEQYFAPSSRSTKKTNWKNIRVKEYFKSLNK